MGMQETIRYPAVDGETMQALWQAYLAASRAYNDANNRALVEDGPDAERALRAADLTMARAWETFRDARATDILGVQVKASVALDYVLHDKRDARGRRCWATPPGDMDIGYDLMRPLLQDMAALTGYSVAQQFGPDFRPCPLPLGRVDEQQRPRN